MAGLDPAIHVFTSGQNVDDRIFFRLFEKEQTPKPAIGLNRAAW
jgi:hypothetical protein